MPDNKKKILLVEDDTMLIEMYKLKFSEEGYEVVVCSDGSEVHDTVKKEMPGIILLDIILPGMDGFAILEALKADTKTKNIPVILLSNLGQESDMIKGKKLGAIDYLVKANYTPTQVAEKIKNILKS